MSTPPHNRDSGYKHITPEDFLDLQGVEYNPTHGSRGPQFNIKDCPSCGSDNWKVYLNRDNGFGNCFRCGKGYNLWTFCADMLGSEDKAAVGKEFDRLAKQVGWRPKASARRAALPVQDGDFTLPANIKLPTAAGQRLQYLDERGVGPNLCQHFDLRYCHDGWYNFDEGDEQKGQKFSGRVIIPVFDLDGRMVTFQGRDITGMSEKKYLFPKQRPGTARFLYNGHEAFRRKASHVVLGEGAFDVIAIKRALDEDVSMSHLVAVGSFGKDLTLVHDPNRPTQLDAILALREAGLSIITILWDGETKALISAMKAARALCGYRFEVRIGFLPRGKDPAEVTSNQVRYAIRSALPYSKTLELRVHAKKPYG